LGRDGRLVARALSIELDVSEDTIRRDLREMARDGLLQRVHGGALPASPATGNLAARGAIALDDKQAIGRAGARLIQPGQVVFVDGGTTAVQLVRQLAPDLRATIVTHSPVIACELLPFENIDVIILGGRLMRHSMVALGAATVEAIGRLRADLYFMGVCSLHSSGLSTGDFEEACVKRALCQAAAETIVLASSEKLATAAPFKVVAPYRERGITIHTA